MRPPAFKYLAYSGLDCNATATGASSSSTSMPEDQQNQTTFSIEEDAIMSEGIRVMLEHMNFFLFIIRYSIYFWFANNISCLSLQQANYRTWP